MAISNQPLTKRLLHTERTQRAEAPKSDIFAGIIALASFLGFLDASYLTAEHYFTLPLPCSLTHGCDTVLTSPYATLGGIPVAFLGVLYYLTILFCAVYFFMSEKQTDLIPRLILKITGAGILFSFGLVYIQAFVIHAFCMYCLGSATLTLTLFIFAILLNRVLGKAGVPGQ